jgi:DNA-binding beta-propeller fold protein YncE
MKGDFTRWTHKPEKHYTRVLRQQGRVDLDADWNEHVEIRAHLDRVQATHMIGPAGVPKADFENDRGFQITWDGTDLLIAPGPIYVDGLHCILEGDAPVAYTDQPDYPSPPALAPVAGQTDLVYLDVWEQHRTALEDPELREVALGGPDTTTRVQTVCQVKVQANVGDQDCDDAVLGWPPTASDARLSVAANAPAASTDPCIIAPAGGFRGLENRFYRVEIHDGGAAGTATFKWSRDNGAVVFAVAAFNVNGNADEVQIRSLGRDEVLALHKNDWVEVLDDGSELRGEPGTLAQIVDLDEARNVLQLSIPIAGYDTGLHARVRRWDQASDALLLNTGTPIPLEDGLEVTFTGTDFHTGDYWMFEARTALPSPPLTDLPPRGIVHHYARLAMVTWQGNAEAGFTADVADCRHPFPPLTDICAEDVCYDNTNCGLVQATTVQEAIDQLCALRDLRHHHKHLHGFGVVCGLQVNCGPDDPGQLRRHVTVRDGYALDCEGNDLILEADRVVDVLQAIADLQAANPNTPLLDVQGNGDVCLSLGLDADGALAVATEAYTPPTDFWTDLFKGSLWQDFYDECIDPWVQLVRSALNPPPPEAGVLVSNGQKTLTTLVNLLWSYVDNPQGQHVYLSPQEDAILRSCYFILREMLKSQTFCAMFDGARPFPDYPFTAHDIPTLFGKGLLGSGVSSFSANLHTRVRVHPGGNLVYTMGSDDRLHVYSRSRGEMVAEVAVPGGTGIIVRDVVFNTAGTQLYAIATLGEDDTLFALADIDTATLAHTWRPAHLLCDLDLRTLATTPADPNRVYAVGKGSGLYALPLENPGLALTPLSAFNAVGHLVLDGTTAYATAAAVGTTTDRYDRVQQVDLFTGATTSRLLSAGTFSSLSGEDDLAVVPTEANRTGGVFVVVDQNGGQSLGTRHLVRLSANPDLGNGLVNLAEDTSVRLVYVSGSGFLQVSYRDLYCVRPLVVDTLTLGNQHNVPVQIYPESMAVAPDGTALWVLNYLSNTLTLLPAAFMNPAADTGLIPAPGSDAFLQALAAYRSGVIEAFLDLLGGFLQYLKDCFCDRFLIDCPTCDEDDRVYLGVVSIRGGQVHKVCNFSKRRYVKSFPLMSYWLSVIPVEPLLRRAFEAFCCTALPDLFAQKTAPQANTQQTAFRSKQAINTMAFYRATDVKGGLGNLTSRFTLARTLATDVVAAGPVTASATTIPQRVVTGQQAAVATSQLQTAGVEVAEVRTYDPKLFGTNLTQAIRAPRTFQPGEKVTIYEQDGVVKFVALAEEPTPATAPVASDQLVTVQGELDTLRTSLGQTQAQLTQRDAEIAALQEQLQTVISQRDTEIATLEDRLGTLEKSVRNAAEMETELTELRAFRTEVTAFMRSRPNQ